jgi:hypothetical protein
MRYSFLYLLCVLLLTIISPFVKAQKAKTHVLTNDEAKVVKKDAATAFAASDFNGALLSYLDLYKTDPQNVDYNYRIGYCYLVTSVNKRAALKYLSFACQSKTAKKEWLFYLGLAYMHNEKWDEAEKSFLEYKNATGSKLIKDFLNPDRMIEMCGNGRTLCARPVNCKITNLGKNVNSITDDYNPFISPDGKALVFTSRRKGNTGGFIEELGIYTADIYSALWRDTAWAKARNVGTNLNAEWDEESVGLSPIGDQLFIYFDNVMAYADIGVSSLKGKMWQRPFMLPEPINSKSLEGGACISNDGSTIYFSSDRKEGKGGKDIWMVKKGQNGLWGVPENLGGSVNSIYDESNPFLTLDGSKLYFCSKGFNSMGGFDIFYSKWNPSLNSWGTPVNAGFPINNADDNTTISFTADERFAFISLIKETGIGEKDNYMVEFLDTMQHGFYGYLSGNIISSGGRIEVIKVTLENKKSSTISEFKPATNSNYFILPARPGEYILRVEGYNFAPYSEEITVESEFPPVEIKKNITVQSSR